MIFPFNIFLNLITSTYTSFSLYYIKNNNFRRTKATRGKINNLFMFLQFFHMTCKPETHVPKSNKHLLLNFQTKNFFFSGIIIIMFDSYLRMKSRMINHRKIIIACFVFLLLYFLIDNEVYPTNESLIAFFLYTNFTKNFFFYLYFYRRDCEPYKLFIINQLYNFNLYKYSFPFSNIFHVRCE